MFISSHHFPSVLILFHRKVHNFIAILNVIGQDYGILVSKGQHCTATFMATVLFSKYEYYRTLLIQQSKRENIV